MHSSCPPSPGMVKDDTRARTSTPQKVKALVQDKLFNQCTELPLKGHNGRRVVPLKIDALAGKCIRIADGDASRPGPVQMVIQVEADSTTQLNQYGWVQPVPRKRHSRLQASGMTEMGRHLCPCGRWISCPMQQMSLIVTNMDAAPWETKSHSRASFQSPPQRQKWTARLSVRCRLRAARAHPRRHIKKPAGCPGADFQRLRHPPGW